MYNESSFKNYLFWIKVKRIFFMLTFSIVGCIIGIVASDYIVNILGFDSIFRTILVAISTLFFFSISLLVTANTGKEVQDGYWKIAVLRKLSVISQKLDTPNINPVEINNVSKALNQTITESLEEDNITIKPKKAVTPAITKKAAPTSIKPSPIIDTPPDPTTIKRKKKKEGPIDF